MNIRGGRGSSPAYRPPGSVINGVLRLAISILLLPGLCMFSSPLLSSPGDFDPECEHWYAILLCFF